MIISIHQPNYIPWLGYFEKILSSDIFVFLDNVQYEKNYLVNRNKIRTSDGSMWLTIPVNVKHDSLLNKIRIDNSQNWPIKHKKSIQINYAKSDFLCNYEQFFNSLYERRFDLLIDINMEIILYLMKQLDINTKTILSSELHVEGTGSNRILDICKSLNADCYISGQFGKNYLNLEDFKNNGIEIKFHNFTHPVYKQCYDPFVPNMSVIDLLFNEGKNSRNILRTNKQSLCKKG